MNKYISYTYQFGVIGGAVCLLAFIVFEWAGFDPTTFSMIFGYVLIPIILFVGIKFFRDKVNVGVLSFSEGMTIGLFIYSIAASVSGLGIFIILWIFPNFFQRIKDSKLTLLESNKDLIFEKFNEESYQDTYASMIEMTPIDIAFNDFIWKILSGLFFTILISIILKKTKL
jgi:hypothetical protein